MTTHYFEHPLQHLNFFRALFDLLEIFEQIQLKSELAKDIEKQRQTYRNWLNFDGVDQNTLQEILQEVDQVHSQLPAF